jgi:hypothetical protein
MAEKPKREEQVSFYIAIDELKCYIENLFFITGGAA